MKKNITPTPIARAIARALSPLAAAALLVALSTACSKDKEPPILSPDGTEIQQPGKVVVTPIPTPGGGSGEDPITDVLDIYLTPSTGNPYKPDASTSTPAEAGDYVITIIGTPEDTPLPPSVAIIPGRPTTDGTGTAPGTGIITITPNNDGELPSLPPINGGTGTVTVIHKGEVNSSVALYPLTREVVITGQLQGVDPTQMDECRATLYGISASRDISKPFGTASATALAASTRAATEYHVTSLFTPAADGSFSLVFRLLGVDNDARQRLVIAITPKDTTIEPFSYAVDVTSIFEGFNEGIASTPAEVETTLTFSIDGVTGTINGWTPGTGGDITGK